MEGEEDRVWETCCSKSSSSFLRYVSQLVVTLAVLSLSIGMLASGSSDALYPSLITLILGVYLPTPTHKSILPEPQLGRRERASARPNIAGHSPPLSEAAQYPDSSPAQ